MRVQKCYIAQRRTGEIVPARQVNRQKVKSGAATIVSAH